MAIKRSTSKNRKKQTKTSFGSTLKTKVLPWVIRGVIAFSC